MCATIDARRKRAYFSGVHGTIKREMWGAAARAVVRKLDAEAACAAPSLITTSNVQRPQLDAGAAVGTGALDPDAGRLVRLDLGGKGKGAATKEG